jgi:hypothetical protein
MQIPESLRSQQDKLLEEIRRMEKLVGGPAYEALKVQDTFRQIVRLASEPLYELQKR